MKIHSKRQSTRQLIAQEAARMLANGECVDFQSARRKSAARLGCRDQRWFPDNIEIDAALRDYQKLFKGDSQPETLEQLRCAAVQAMEQLHSFTPRLTGPVLDGTADVCSPIQLHLFADTAEELVFYLMERAIPFEQEEIKMRHAGGKSKSHPLFAFQAGDTTIELILLSPADRADPPLDSRSDKPCAGSSLSQVKALLAGESADI